MLLDSRCRQARIVLNSRPAGAETVRGLKRGPEELLFER